MTNVHHLAPSSTSTESLPLHWIEALFEKMSMSYGRKFTEQWATVDPDKLKAHWAKELACMNRQELTRGYSALESRDWPPSLPEFKKMCRPPIEPIAAYYEALEQGQLRDKGETGTWSHPAIYWAWAKIGAFDFKNHGFSTLKTRWEKALADELEKKEWAAVPVPALALPEPGKAHLSREEADKRMRELKAQDATKKVAAKTDHLLWAKRIMERVKRGDKTLNSVQIRFAKEALGAA